MAGNELKKIDEFQIALDDIQRRLKLVEEIGKNIKRSPVIYGYHGKRLDLNDNLDVLKLKRNIESGEVITTTINTVTTLTEDISQLSLSNLPSDPDSNINCNGQRITNLFAPSLSGDAANKSYVDAVFNSISSNSEIHILTLTTVSHSINSSNWNEGDVVFLILDSTSGSFTVTLPSVTSIDKIKLHCKLIGANNVTFNLVPGQTIDDYI